MPGMAAKADPMEESENKAPESSVGSVSTPAIVAKPAETAVDDAGKEMTRCEIWLVHM